MTITLTKRRLLLGMGACLLVGAAFLLLARAMLTGLAVNALLQLAGASEIRFSVTHATPWRVVVEDIGFQVRTQSFEAKRVTVVRRHWWMPSLGTVTVEQARVPVTIDGSDTNPVAWTTYSNGKASVEPWQAPLEALSLDGQLVVKAATLPSQELAVKMTARQTSGKTWSANVQATGPGLTLRGEGSYDVGADDLTFKVPAVELDLKVWQEFVRRMVVIPGGAWTIEGKVTGSAEGRLAGKQLTTGGTLRVREGRASNTALSVSAEGIEADLEFTDFAKVLTKPGTLKIAEVRTGKLVLREHDYVFALEGTEKIVVTKASLKALGGTVQAEPFKYFPDLRELDAVVTVDGISVEEVMALTQDLPAKATGRLNGRLPLHIDDNGVRLGTGWLQLKPGVYAEIQFSTTGLLTTGVSPNSPQYAVLKKVESGLLKLKISEMRLDIRPPDAPAGRSAQLHIAGQPVDLNVNGPLEKLLNLGLDSRLSFGSKP
jgi:hypothetical protein